MKLMALPFWLEIAGKVGLCYCVGESGEGVGKCFQYIAGKQDVVRRALVDFHEKPEKNFIFRGKRV